MQKQQKVDFPNSLIFFFIAVETSQSANIVERIDFLYVFLSRKMIVIHYITTVLVFSWLSFFSEANTCGNGKSSSFHFGTS